MQFFGSLVIGCTDETTGLLGETFDHLGLPRPKIVQSGSLHTGIFDQRGLRLIFFGAPAANEVLACAAASAPGPRLVLVGEAAARIAFECALSGVSTWLDRPAGPGDVVRAMETALSDPPALERVAASQLGRHGLREAQRVVRRSMIEEAMLRTGGNRHAAARLLQVDRRAVQLALKEMEGESGQANDTAPPTSADLSDLAADRVRRVNGRVVAWRELPVQSVDWIGAVFGRLSELSGSTPTDLVINLAEAQYPAEEVRETLRSHFVQASQLHSVSISVGNNESLALAAKLVIPAGCPVTLHGSYESAVEHATLAAVHRNVSTG